MDILQVLNKTPLPTVLVVAGILFLLLAVTGGISGKLNVPRQRQQLSAIFGVVLLIAGLAIYLIPVSGTDVSHADPGKPSATGPAPQAGVDHGNAADVRKDSGALETFRKLPLVEDESFVQQKPEWDAHFSTQWGRFESRAVAGKMRYESFFKGGGWQSYKMPLYPAADFFVSADFRVVDETVGSYAYGFLLRRAGNSWYTVELSGNGKVLISRNINGKYTTLLEWAWIPGFDPKVVNRLAVGARGDEISVFLNGALVAKVRDGSLQSGNVLFLVQHWKKEGGSLVVDMDNVEYRTKR